MSTLQGSAPKVSNIIYADPRGIEKTIHHPSDPSKLSKIGIRSLAVDYNEELIACGDRNGNIM